MRKSLVPDMMFGEFDGLTPDILIGLGIEYLFIDIDNTLVPYEMEKPEERHFDFFARMREMGIKCILISNNDARRVELFAKELGVPAYPDCKKPSLRRIKRIIAEQNVISERAAFLGDQLFTDALTARRLGMTVFTVPPIKDKKTLLFRVKRFMETPFIKAYKRKHGGDTI